MNNETCRCNECGTDILPNMGFQVRRVWSGNGKEYFIDLCDTCWYNEDKAAWRSRRMGARL